jgi:hypothetical protein
VAPPLDQKKADGIFKNLMQPVAWLVSGRRLFASAKILLNDQGPVADRYWAEAERVAREAARRGIRPAWDEMAFPVPNFDGAYLLLAYTIENLLKGLLIAQKKEHISESNYPKIFVVTIFGNYIKCQEQKPSSRNGRYGLLLI